MPSQKKKNDQKYAPAYGTSHSWPVSPSALLVFPEKLLHIRIYFKSPETLIINRKPYKTFKTKPFLLQDRSIPNYNHCTKKEAAVFLKNTFIRESI